LLIFLNQYYFSGDLEFNTLDEPISQTIRKFNLNIFNCLIHAPPHPTHTPHAHTTHTHHPHTHALHTHAPTHTTHSKCA